MSKLIKMGCTIIGWIAVYKIGELSGCVRTIAKGLEHSEIRNAVSKELSNKLYNYIYSPSEMMFINGDVRAIKEDIFDCKEDADKIIDGLLDILKEEGFVKVSDYRMACGYSLRFTDDLYGWNTMTGWRVVRDIKHYDKYKILYPTPISLK